MHNHSIKTLLIYLSLFTSFIAPLVNTCTVMASEQWQWDVDTKKEMAISPLGKAIIARDTHQALDLIKNGADLRAYQNETTIRKIVTPTVKTTYIGNINLLAYPLIILAAVSGQDEIIKAIMAQDHDAVFLRDYHQNDALAWAAREGHASTVSLLLSYGFDPLYKSAKSGSSAYELALEKEEYAVLDLIMLHLIQQNRTEKLPEAIWFLSGSEQTGLLEKYLKLGIKDSYKAIKPRTSLMKAARDGRLDNFKLLVQYGSDPYESNVHGFDHNYDPLTYAMPNTEFTTYLLENFDYDLSKTFEGRNYLQLAYNRYDRLDQKTFLLLLQKSGLDINSTDEYGNTLLDQAVANIDIEYVKFFLSLGMEDNAVQKALSKLDSFIKPKNAGKTTSAYDRAAMEGLREIRKILMDKIHPVKE